MDYSPKFKEPYDVFDKAGKHIQKIKNKEKLMKVRENKDDLSKLR